MKPFFIKLVRGFVLLALLQGQLAYALPGVPAFMVSGCRMHMATGAAMSGCHHARRNGSDVPLVSTRNSGDLCQHDGCCDGCNVCAHGAAVFRSVRLASIAVKGAFNCEIGAPAPDPHPAAIIHPPWRLLQS